MTMKILSIAAVAGLLIGSTAIVQAQSRGGTGEGASTASPRHEMKQPRSRSEKRAGVAPRHRTETTGAGDRDDFTTGSGGFTTGSGGRDVDDDHVRHDTDGLMMDNDRRGIDKE